MPSLNTSIISTPQRTHRRLLTRLDEGHYELCLDNTTLEKALTCPRSFEFYAVMGRDVGERDALNYGSALHRALELHFHGEPLDAMIASLVESFQKTPCSPDSWRNLDHAIESVRRYHALRAQLPPWRPLNIDGASAIELPFKLKLFDIQNVGLLTYPAPLVIADEANDVPHVIETLSVYWTGKIDLITEVNGEVWAVDHKTTSIGGDTFWRAWQQSAQMHGYTWATSMLLGGRPVAGAIIDAIIGRKPTRTGVPYEFEQQHFAYTNEKVSEWLRDTEAHIRRLVSYLTNGYFPKATTWCANKYGLCPWFDVCSMSLPVQPQVLMSGMYTERTWNPLKQ